MGGTGSYGNAVIKRFIHSDANEILFFSRNEQKQVDIRHECQVKYPEFAHIIKFYIGDVRNKSTLKTAMHEVDYIFYASALEHVPTCEFFTMEALKYDVIGMDSVLDAAIDAGTRCVICLSTDKAAFPIITIGINRALDEKAAVAKSHNSLKISIF